MNKQLYSNCIIVGGMIAAGKSSLVESLQKNFDFRPIFEYDENNKLQTLILKKLYEGKRIHIPTTQFYFTSLRYQQYREGDTSVLSILDRSLWEDYFFAKLLMGPHSKEFKMYEAFWEETIIKMTSEIGKPKAYLFLKIDWPTFKNRIYGRNREIEISNFYNNKDYFEKLLNEYNTNFVPLLIKHGINVITIDTSNLTKEEVLDKAIEELRAVSIV